MARDPYFDRSEVSHSDLSSLDKYLNPGKYMDMAPEALEKIFAFGTLIDMMITEPEKVDFFKLTCNGYQHTKEEFETAIKMKQAFDKDSFAPYLKIADKQKVMAREMEFNYNGFTFTMPVRCKWDLWMHIWGGDIKSTSATTQKQFEEACKMFNYDRSRAFYMDIANSDRDLIIGISKVNFKVFKVYVERGDAFYNAGKEAYSELAFHYMNLLHSTGMTLDQLKEQQSIAS